MIRRGEWSLAIQPLGDDGVGLRNPQHHERLPEALDVRGLPRLPGDEVLGNDTRLSRLRSGEVGIGQAGLRLVHGGLQAAIDTHLDQLQQRRDVRRHAVDERLQQSRGGLEF